MTAPVDGRGDDDAARARDANDDVVTDVPAKRAKTTPTSARGEPSPGTAAAAPTETRPASVVVGRARRAARERKEATRVAIRVRRLRHDGGAHKGYRGDGGVRV